MAQSQTTTVYRFIRRYLQENGYPPSRAEIEVHSGLSAQQVGNCLRRLENQRRLIVQLDKPRGLWLNQCARAS